jgi:hypothetical protein
MYVCFWLTGRCRTPCLVWGIFGHVCAVTMSDHEVTPSVRVARNYVHATQPLFERDVCARLLYSTNATVQRAPERLRHLCTM